jgi:hypothetical protein
MDLTKRSTKGSALTHSEMDANWAEIEDYAAATDTRIGVSLNTDGTIKSEKVTYASSLVGTDSYAIAVPGTIPTVSDLAGRILLVKIDVANTGPATLQANALAATAIYRPGGVALKSGDLKPGVAELTLYPGGTPYFVLLNPGAQASGNYGASSNSGNAYTVTVADLGVSDFEVPAAYYAGYEVSVKINADNTGATTLNIVATTPAISLGAANVYKNGSTPLESGDLKSGRVYKFVHDGSAFQVIAQTPQSVILQQVEASPTSSSSNAAAISFDGTVPQITEGTEILTLSITPKSASSKLYVEAVTHLGNNGGNNKTLAALFRDATTDAISASVCNVDGSGSVETLVVKTVENANSTSATTFRLRVGADSGTVYWNRSSSQTLGTSMKTTIWITEVLNA